MVVEINIKLGAMMKLLLTNTIYKGKNHYLIDFTIHYTCVLNYTIITILIVYNYLTL